MFSDTTPYSTDERFRFIMEIIGLERRVELSDDFTALGRKDAYMQIDEALQEYVENAKCYHLAQTRVVDQLLNFPEYKTLLERNGILVSEAIKLAMGPIKAQMGGRDELNPRWKFFMSKDNPFYPSKN